MVGVVLLFYPVGQFFGVENWAFFAHAFVAFVAVYHAAEAGTNAASHHILERHLAFDAFLEGIASNCFHHRSGAAGVDVVVIG